MAERLARTAVLWNAAASAIEKKVAGCLPRPPADVVLDSLGIPSGDSLPNPADPIGFARCMLNQAGDLYASVSRIGDNSIAAGHCTASTFYQMGAYPVAEFLGVVNASYLYDNTNPLTGERAGTGETWFRTTIGSLQLVTTAVGVKTALPVKFGPAGVLAPRGTAVAEEGGLTLFKWNHFSSTRASGWRDGDRFLYLPNQGSVRANWVQNFSRLRAEMRIGKPIFDSYVDEAGSLIATKGFLKAER